MSFRSIILGAPGSGKGTLAKRLVTQLPRITAFSTGDLLRKESLAKTELGALIDGFMHDGRLVPDDTMTKLILSVFNGPQKLSDPSASWISDGFPRTVRQATLFDKYLGEHNIPLTSVIHLDVPNYVIIDRISNRWVHPGSGRIYNVDHNPPKVPGKDDITGEPLERRVDDNVETFRRRLDSYQSQAGNLLEYYNKRGLVKTFSGTTSNEIFPKLLAYVETFKDVK